MTIQLDNGTDIQITKALLSFTNDTHGFSWDLESNHVYVGEQEVAVSDADENTQEILNLIRDNLLAILG